MKVRTTTEPNIRGKPWAVVPLKRLYAAKQRLRTCLSARERRRLVVTMLGDVLSALSNSRGLAGYSVVSGDSTVIGMAHEYGAEVIKTKADRGQSAALYHATHVLAGAGINKVMMIPGDIPLVTSIEIDCVASSLQATNSVTVVGNQEGTGTNCMATFLPLPIPLAYGTNSLPQHCSLIECAGLKVLSLPLAGLKLDIDTRQDLQTLDLLAARTDTQKLLAGNEFSKRLKTAAGQFSGVQSPALVGQ